jgi:hypothetical protein
MAPSVVALFDTEAARQSGCIDRRADQGKPATERVARRRLPSRQRWVWAFALTHNPSQPKDKFEQCLGVVQGGGAAGFSLAGHPEPLVCTVLINHSDCVCPIERQPTQMAVPLLEWF